MRGHNKRIYKPLLIILVTFQFFILLMITRPVNPQNCEAYPTNTIINPSTITIIGDSQLNSTASSGNGTSGNPFIIENLVITGDGSDSIDIRYTQAYFIIRNCTCINGSTGIFLYNVKNAMLINNSLMENGVGIWLQETENVILERNNITHNGQGVIIFGATSDIIISSNNISSNRGVGLRTSGGLLNNLTLTHNLVQNNTKDGISLVVANSNITENIIIENGEKGMAFHKSENNTVSGNSIKGNEYGLYLDSSFDNTYAQNNISQNQYGIYLIKDSSGSSANNTFIGNRIVNNTQGVYLTDANCNQFLGNIINNNAYYGIYLSNSSNNSIKNNFLLYNEEGIYETPDCIGNILENNTIINRLSGADGLDPYIIFLCILCGILASSILVSGGLYRRNKTRLPREREGWRHDKITLWLGLPYLVLIALVWINLLTALNAAQSPWTFENHSLLLSLIGCVVLIPVFSCTTIFLLTNDRLSEIIAFSLASPSWALILIGGILGVGTPFYQDYREIPILFVVFICLQIVLGLSLFIRNSLRVRRH